MIYFDNAATTLIKPHAVSRAVKRALEKCGNPSRGGHFASLCASEVLFNCRNLAADVFGLKNAPERVVFTNNATHSLNLAIKSILHDGGHAVVSGYEHNSVIRPLEEMKKSGVSYAIARSKPFEPDDMIKKISEQLSLRKTDCLIINHVSNVFGYELPVDKIDEICVRKGIPLILDASQSAGSIEIDVSSLRSAAFICMPGHKMLFGPQGTGILLCCNDKKLYSLIQGGTGSESRRSKQPDYLPDIFESGTPNMPGIAGLYQGIKFISDFTLKEIRKKEKYLLFFLLQELSAIKNIRIFTGEGHYHPVLSFSFDSADSETVCEMLAREGIALRGGMHCAPVAHESAGTYKSGTVRVSLSVFNDRREIKEFAEKLNKMHL